MIADDFDSIKKALEEILKEKEKEKAPKGDRLIVDDPHTLRPGTGNSDVNAIWVWRNVVGQSAQPKVTDPGHTHSSNQQGSGQTNVPAPQQTTP